MAFTPPHTFVDGDTLNAEDWQGNCDALRVYLDKVEAGAISTEPWVEAQHIVKPFIYELGGGRTGPELRHGDFASVVLEGAQIAPLSNVFSWSSVYNTAKLGDGSLVEVPRTSVKIDLRYPGSLTFQWWAYGVNRDNEDVHFGTAKLYCYKGTKDANQLDTQGNFLEEKDGLIDWPPHLVRYNISGYEIVENLTSGTYTIGLTTRSTSANTNIYAWGFLATFHHM